MDTANAIPRSISKPYIDSVQGNTTINKNVHVDFAELSREEPIAVSKEVVNLVEADLSGIVISVNQFVKDMGQKVSFSCDDRAENPVIIVQDNETGNVIRQIPQEEMLELMAKLEDIAGIIFHRKA